MMEVKSDAVRTILHRNLECYVHESRQIGSGQTGDGKSEHRHFKNQRTIMHKGMKSGLKMRTVVSLERQCQDFQGPFLPHVTTFLQARD